ncbi:hypothetical protein B566_EDAN004295 [Ephemera danica]|nr:hypothetical protein B566_EDAN004295 [Ephemera danica]
MSREELIDHDDSGTSNPALADTEHDPPLPPPSPRPALQPLRISTNSGLTYLPGDDAYIAANLALHTTPLSSPLSYSSESGAAEMNTDGSLTPAGLSWRRLHVSRAKLKATATTSELLSGFAMVAMVELQINENTKVPEWLFVLFSICTTVLVAVHIFALMISTYILPSIDAVSRLHSPGGGEAAELVAESPHERLRWFIELAWAFSTVLGLFLFLVEGKNCRSVEGFDNLAALVSLYAYNANLQSISTVLVLVVAVFWDHSFAAALASTAIVVPALAVFVGFAVHFYHTLVVHKCEASDNDLKQLERIKQQLDAVKPGV